MLRFFRSADPLRLIFVLLAFAGLRFFFLAGNPKWAISELYNAIIGKRLAKEFLLYVDVWDNTPPLSGLVMELLASTGESMRAWTWGAVVLLGVFQALFYQQLFSSREFTRERTILPALCYLVLLSITQHLGGSLPEMLGVSFLMPCITGILSPREKRDAKVLLVYGFFMGCAALAFRPTLWLVLWFWLAWLIQHPVKVRGLALFFTGLLTPFGIAWGVFFSDGQEEAYLIQFVWRLSLHFPNWTEISSVLVLGLGPLILAFVWAQLRILQHGRFTNFQQKVHQALFLWCVFTSLIILFSDVRHGEGLTLLVPGAAFLVAHAFMLYRKRIIPELLFLSFLGGSLAWSYSLHYIPKGIENALLGDIVKPFFIDEVKAKEYKSKRIIVLGEAPSYYFQNELSGPYLNPELTADFFLQLNSYSGVVQVYEQLEQEQPEVLIDQAGVAQKIFGQIKPLQKQYRKIEGKPGHYERVKD